ncbi:MAG: hypothetical protein QOH39_3594 [Verrucomicrobiota bacterium]|jgi:predicted ATPase/class 3 adenylate cyclase
MPDRDPQADELKAAIAGLEAQRALLGDSVVEPALAALRQQLAELNAPRVALEPAEERKLVTIVFVDVSGFTALAEKLDAEEVRNVINACFECLVPIVQKYGGTVDKFIGDEIMALFGAPVAHENDPERALRSALEMMEAISLFNREHGTGLDLHIGVNTGPVVTGAIGSQNRRDYSVMGDAVNLASRLEDASANGEVYVGPNTYRHTATIFDFEALPPLQLKGKSQPVKVYRLVGLAASPKASRGIEGLQARLVGRSREMAQMEEAFRLSREGQGSVVMIVGDAGLGKSRLVAEALRIFAADICVAEGRALSHTTAMNYRVARNILRALLGVEESSSSARLATALRSSIETTLPKSAIETYPYLARLLDLPLQENMEERVKFLTSEALQGRILQAFHDYVDARARREQLILFWEDLHWCDPSSLRVLETLLTLTAKTPLLILLAYRSGEEAIVRLQEQTGALGAEKVYVINLVPLTRDESGSLVNDLLKLDRLPVKMSELILNRAEGNPFFVEELIRSLLDTGVLVRDGGRVVAKRDIESVDVPETLQGVLAARIDRLRQETKHTLQSAAVIGRIFQHNVLARIHDSNPTSNRQLTDSLGELQKREFIQSRAQNQSEESEYTFKHAITQDVAYQTLLRAKRRELHKLVAEALEALFPERLTELSPTLGYHFERAEAHEKALHYLEEAGKHAQATFANTEAIAFYRSALVQADFLFKSEKDLRLIENVARIHEALGDVLTLAGQGDEARAAYTTGLSLLPGHDRIGRSRLHRKVGASYVVQRRYEEMSQAFDAADQELGENADEPAGPWWKEKVHIQLERMHLFYWQGMSDAMMRLAEQYRARVEAKGTPIQRGKFFQMLALSHLTRARYVAPKESLRLAELAVSMSEGSVDLSEAAHVRFCLGLVQLYRNHLPQAVESCAAALELAERVGNVVVAARCLTYMTVAYRRMGDVENTRQFGERTIEVAAKIGMVEYVAMAKANLAWLAWREGRPDDAELLGTDALRLWHGMEDPYGMDWMALLPLVAIATTRGDLESAVTRTCALFGENQHPLPQELTAAAKELIGAKGNLEMVKADLLRLIEISKKIGYL